MHNVHVHGLLPWVDWRRLLGPGDWVHEGRSAHTTLPTHAAADLDARLRNVAIGGSPLAVDCTPPLPRAAVRAARTTDARRRRDATPGFTRAGVRLDAEGKVSLTPEALALDLARRVTAGGRTAPTADPPLTVVDAGCGAGGNTIAFARAGCMVTALDADASRLADARHNAGVYGVQDRIRFQHGDALQIVPRLTADLLFLDPPWGVDWSRSGMGMADLPLLDLVAAARARFRRIVLKLPPSFRVHELPDARPEAIFGLETGDHRRVKFLLVTIAGSQVLA